LSATTATRHPHHFEDLSPEQFERLVYWLVRRSGEFDEVQWYGGARDKGRDVVAYKHAEAGREKWYIQCKRYQSIGFPTLRDELDKLAKHAEKTPGFAPGVVVFATACPVPPQAKDQAGAHARALGLPEPYYWGRLELDERLKAQPDTEEEFFGAGREATPPPFTVPPDLATFTGREKLLKELDELLQPGGTASVAIVGLKGMAGVGKSALAVHAAHTWRERFPDGVAWVDLRAERGACDALRHVAGLYGYRKQAAELGDDRQALTGLVRTVLQGKRALLILDNAEDLKAEELDCPLPGVAGPVTVVTSRREFAALGRLGKRLRVDVMAEEEALALLGQLVGEERVERGHSDYAKLAERLGWLPLALDIAGRRMADRGWGPGEMVRRLEAAKDRPSFLALPVAERPEESVALAFALSYEGLGKEDAEVFRALGAFAPVGFTARAVASVVGSEVEGEAALEGLEGKARKELEELLAAGVTVFEADETAAEATLERLEALSLVRRAAREGTQAEVVEGRYDLHPLVRDYAQALSEKAGERERWAERHARYFVALAGWGRDQLGNPETALAAVATAAVERGNLLAAQEACVGLGMWEEAVSLAYDLGRLFERSGHWADRRRALERGIEAAREGGDENRAAELSHNLGTVYYQTGQYGEAQARYEQALEFKREVDDQRGVATELHQLGVLAQAQGDYPEAHRLYQESLDIKQQLGDRASVAVTLHELGRLAQAQGDYPEARRLYQESLDITQQPGDRAGVAISLHELGRLAQKQGDYPEARRLYQESLDIQQQLGDRAGVARSFHQLGRLAQDQGDYAEARRLYQESLDIARQLGDRAGVAISLHNLGALAQDQGDYPQARRLYQESLDIARQLGNRAGVARSLHNLGALAQAQGDYPEAHRLYQESLDIKQQLGDRAGVAKTLNTLGNLAFAEGDRVSARKLLSESLGTAQSLSDRLQVAYAGASLALVEEAEGDLPRALELMREAEGIFTKLRSPEAVKARRVRERLEGEEGG